MITKCRLWEAEELISRMDLSEVEDDIAETEEDFQIAVSGYYVIIPDMNLQLHDGILCNWNEAEQMFMPDAGVTVIYEVGADRSEYIYFEQDGMVISLYNLMNGKICVSRIEKLWCEIVVPDENDSVRV